MLAFFSTERKSARRAASASQASGALGATLARAASRTDAGRLAEHLEAIWWQAPEGFQLRSLLNGLDEDIPLRAQPPIDTIDGITVVSPFLSPEFLKEAGKWGPHGSRTLISSMPALVDMANRSSKPLKGFSKILAYAAPDMLPDESAVALPGNEAATEDDAEPSPLALHAKLVCFHLGDRTIFRTGSANATERAWAGRNSEVMLELEAGDAFTSGLVFLVGKATPVSIEDLAARAPPNTRQADALEESRKMLMALWNPTLRRDGERFSIDAGATPLLAYRDHQLLAGAANGDLLPWPSGRKSARSRSGSSAAPICFHSGSDQRPGWRRAMDAAGRYRSSAGRTARPCRAR